MKTLKTIISICTLNLSFCICSNAQIVYTDVIPDQTFSANNSVYHLDLNNDSTTDFDISIETGNVSGHNYARIKILTLDTNAGVITATVPAALSINSLIDGTKIWSSDTLIMAADAWSYQHIWAWGHWHWAWLHYISGPWLNATDKYLGLKFYSGGNIYYGWARLNTLVTSNATANFTIKDYAYNSIPNQPILAGQSWSFINGTGITSICTGDSTILAVPGGASYLWNTGDTTGSITVSPLITTTYLVTLYDSVLASTVSFIQQIIVNSVTASIIQTNDSLIAVGGDSSSAYQWIDCATHLQIAGANSNIFAPQTGGIYAAIIYKNGCSDTSNCITIVFTGIHETLQESEFDIAPNPFSNSTTISFSLTQLQNVSLKIFDVKGMLVETLTDKIFTIGKHQIEFNAEKIDAGIYFLKMQVGDFIETKKISVIK